MDTEISYNKNLKILNLIFLEGGLNNIYSEYKNQIIDYESLLQEIIKFNFGQNFQKILDDELFYGEFLEINKGKFTSKNKYEYFFKKNELELNELYYSFVEYLNEKNKNLHLNSNYNNENLAEIKELKINPKNFQVLEKEFLLKNLEKFPEGKYHLAHDSLLNLLIDYIILKNFHLENLFNLIINPFNSNENLSENKLIKIDNVNDTNNTNYNNEIENENFYPKNFIFFSYIAEKLYKFYKRGNWIIFLTTFIYIELNNSNIYLRKKIDEINLNNKNFIIEINKKEKEIEKEKEKEIEKEKEKEKGNFFNFSINFYTCLLNYFPLIHEINKISNKKISDFSLLNEKINQLKPIRIFIYIKTLFKNREFIRSAYYYISDFDIFYESSVGFDEIENFYLNFDSKEKIENLNVLFYKLNSEKIEEKDKLIQTSNFFIKKFPKIYLINNLENLEDFSNKDKMVNLLNRLVNRSKTQEILKEYNLKLFVPKSKEIKFSIVNSKEKFLNFIESNNFGYPLVLKFTGMGKKFEHFISVLLNGDCVGNYVDFIKGYIYGNENNIQNNNNSNNNENQDQDDKIDILFQSFFNHHGKFIKLYWVNNQSIIFIR
jgi:hypothetical protein